MDKLFDWVLLGIGIAGVATGIFLAVDPPTAPLGTAVMIGSFGFIAAALEQRSTLLRTSK